MDEPILVPDRKLIYRFRRTDSEQFLADVSSDPATSRKIPVRPTRQRQASNRSRPQSFMQQSNSEERVVQVDPKTGLRPLSMLAGRNDSRETASPEPIKEQTEAASEKRVRQKFPSCARL